MKGDTNIALLILPSLLVGDAEREYWSLLRGNQEKWRENKGNRGRLV